MAVNRAWRVAKRPVGLPTRDDFRLSDEPIPLLVDDGDVLVRIEFVSLDPAMRGWLRPVKSYLPPVEIDAVMRAGTAGRVIGSKNPTFPVGAAVTGNLGVQQYALVKRGRGLTVVDEKVAALPVWLGALGMPGMTAFFGLFDIGKPKAGETVVVSGAAGAVGSVVVQLAKLHGCRVVGFAGSEAKCQWVRELGADACILYRDKTNAELAAELRKHTPKNIDVYFDNVGVPILDLCLARLAMRARVVLCGGISQYNATGAPVGPSNYMSLLVNRARIEGFVVFDYASRYAEASAQMVQWMSEGRLKARVDIVENIEQFPDALLKLFASGDDANMGKLVLDVRAPAQTARL